MKTRILPLLLVLTMVFAHPFRSLAESTRNTSPIVSVAIFDFQISDEKLESKGAEAAMLLGTTLSNGDGIVMVERQELKKILGEQNLGMSGSVTQDTAAQVGMLTGAKVLITGRLFVSGARYFLVAKIMSTETSRVFGETVVFSDLDGMDVAATELGTKIQGVLQKQSGVLLAKVESPELHIERLRKLVAGKKLPSVSVAVTEQHINRNVIDPAVQTEIQKRLQEIGFKVVDAQAGEKADVAITGEAFSEFATRLEGGLISCRARVEIKATKQPGDTIILIDRQGDAAIDLSENVAGKTALQNAAMKLLDRLVTKILAE